MAFVSARKPHGGSFARENFDGVYAQGSFKNADPAAAARPGDEDKPLTDPSLAAVRQLLMEQVVL